MKRGDRMRLRLLKPHAQKSGRLQVSLAGNEGRPPKKYIHTLVLEAFGGPKPQGMVCRHLNGDPADNRISNLQWGTYQQNAADAIRHGTLRRGERHGAAILNDKQAANVLARLQDGECAAGIARDLGVKPQVVYNIKYGNSWSWLKDANIRSPV